MVAGAARRHRRVFSANAFPAMKNSSSPLRGAPMPGGRSFTQFRAARIRRVSFQWRQQETAGAEPAAKGGGPRRS
ncbi:hypothetical protein [Achromobacter xylosoxidans]|jgi:hypothetical protein|uniref:hypothetical protein n=2 Tax=Alcaligenes xylosoxydans xylosoxydans TaxID=85698 RepID=UPI000A48538C|nr:hypothetical protein [Achromobacter xylosoxidans]MDZ5627864.1 hypothetical protein [Achromobacter xylosoxidans]